MQLHQPQGLNSLPSKSLPPTSTKKEAPVTSWFFNRQREYVFVVLAVLVCFPLARVVDAAVVEFWSQEFRSGQLNGVLRAMKYWGEGITVVLMLLGWFSLRPRLWRNIALVGLAILLSAGVVHGIKWITGRARPAEVSTMEAAEQGVNATWRYTGKSNSSFPSGHTASAFGLASGLARAYPPLTPVVLIAASGTATNRMYEHRHFLSDTIVGAGLGWLTTALFWRRRDDKDLAEFQKSHRSA